MPYIPQDRRAILDAGGEPKNAGELNYTFTQIIKEYLGTEIRYQKINDIIGALEGAKLEVYRRKAANYEDVKCKENGDAY